MADGPGFRTSIYCAGCGHHCPGCHNPQSWDFDGGKEVTVEELLEVVKSDEFSNVTFSGGDPLYQVEAFTELDSFGCIFTFLLSYHRKHGEHQFSVFG